MCGGESNTRLDNSNSKTTSIYSFLKACFTTGNTAKSLITQDSKRSLPYFYLWET